MSDLTMSNIQTQAKAGVYLDLLQKWSKDGEFVHEECCWLQLCGSIIKLYFTLRQSRN